MTTPSDPPQDPWQNTPSMSPEQANQPWGAPPPPGQGGYGGQPGQGGQGGGQPGQGGQGGGQGGPPGPPGYGGQPGPGGPGGPGGPPGQGYPPPPGQYGAPGGQYGGPGQYGGYPPQQQKAGNGLGIAALVLGILGLLLSFGIIGGLPGLVAVVLGIVALRRPGTNKVMPVIGAILGGLAVAISAVVLFVALTNKDVKNLAECVSQAQSEAEKQRCQREFEQNFGQ